MCIPIESADAISHYFIISQKPCKDWMNSSKEIYKNRNCCVQERTSVNLEILLPFMNNGLPF